MARKACMRTLNQSLKAFSFSSQIGGSYRFSSQAAVSLQHACKPSHYSDVEYADVDWDNLGFALIPTDFMYMMKCCKGENFTEGQLRNYGNIELSPGAAVLNYGQGIFEGTKAHRREDGQVVLFRPDMNAIRMQIGAERMCMPAPSIDLFINSLRETVLANKRWVPPSGKGSLYARPMLLGTGANLGVAPAPDYTFLVYASPVGTYFKEGTAPLNLYVEENIHRAFQGGTGGVKSITNYGPVMRALTRAKSRGFSDVLYLDSVDKKNLEEVSASNIFIVKGNVISTPAAGQTILEGITRRSIIEVARLHNYQVEERSVAVEELIDADEVFCTGTAVGVASVGSVTYKDKRIEYRTGVNCVSKELYATIIGIQMGHIEDKMGWIVEID